MKRLLGSIVLALAAGTLTAQEPQPAGEKQGFPFTGTVTADRLNVRLFPTTDTTSPVVCLLAGGDSVTVTGEKDGFYAILPPKGSWIWVFGRSLKIEGSEAVVVADQAPLRIDSRAAATAVGLAARGTKLKIQKEQLGWYRVDPPETVRCYVGRKYIQYVAPAEGITVSPETPGTAPGAAKPGVVPAAVRSTDPHLAEAEALIDEQKKRLDEGRIKDADFRAVIAAFEAAAAAATDPAIKTQAEESAKIYRRLQDMLVPVQAQIEVRERDLESLKTAVNTAPAARFAYTGFVDGTGAALYRRPGTHKLVLGDKMVCFIRARENDPKMIDRFNGLYQQYVGVTGQIVTNPEGWDGYTVVLVDEIVPLANEQ
jgi:hypothetical protein